MIKGRRHENRELTIEVFYRRTLPDASDVVIPSFGKVIFYDPKRKTIMEEVDCADIYGETG